MMKRLPQFIDRIMGIPCTFGGSESAAPWGVCLSIRGSNSSGQSAAGANRREVGEGKKKCEHHTAPASPSPQFSISRSAAAACSGSLQRQLAAAAIYEH
jgi:hypothetical protein